MKYEERLKKYEEEKRKLMELGVSPQEYEKAIIALARKWRI